MALRDLGFRALKLFPAEAVGGAKLLASLAAPLPDLRFCPTGGIDFAKAPDYLKLPNVACVGGSWMLPKDALARGDYAVVEGLAREAAHLATHSGVENRRFGRTREESETSLLPLQDFLLFPTSRRRRTSRRHGRR